MIEKDLERLSKYAQWICRKYGVTGGINISVNYTTYATTCDLHGQDTVLAGLLPNLDLTKDERGRWEE